MGAFLIFIAVLIKPLEMFRMLGHCTWKCPGSTYTLLHVNFCFKVTCDSCGKVFIDELGIGGPT